MKNLSKNLLFGILILFSATVIFSFFLQDPAKKPESLSLNTLAQKINEGSVKKIVVQGDTLQVTLADDSKAEAQKETGGTITETLMNYSVDGEKLKAVELRVENPGGGKYWASIILPSLIPILIMPQCQSFVQVKRLF
jgi:ATP-dependent Zn protease